jgi:hypothetical protein
MMELEGPRSVWMERVGDDLLGTRSDSDKLLSFGGDLGESNSGAVEEGWGG